MTEPEPQEEEEKFRFRLQLGVSSRVHSELDNRVEQAPVGRSFGVGLSLPLPAEALAPPDHPAADPRSLLGRGGRSGGPISATSSTGESLGGEDRIAQAMDPRNVLEPGGPVSFTGSGSPGGGDSIFQGASRLRPPVRPEASSAAIAEQDGPPGLPVLQSLSLPSVQSAGLSTASPSDGSPLAQRQTFCDELPQHALEEEADFNASDAPAGPLAPLPAHEELRGWLLKRSGARFTLGLARAFAGTPLQAAFWSRRYFELGKERLCYWRNEPGSRKPSEAPLGEFLLFEIDAVAVRSMEVALHFATEQRTGRRKRMREELCLRAPSVVEAESWRTSLTLGAAAQLRTVLPSGWDVSAMLNEGTETVRCVAKKQLSQGTLRMVQRLVDHTFVCKRTRDRHSREVPLRLEVCKVDGVQNAAAWIKYNKARARVAHKAAQADPMAPIRSGTGTALQELARQPSTKLFPEVLTSTLDLQGKLGVLSEAANEQWLFHGTTLTGTQGITDKDFRLDLAGSHRGTLYGKGLYLAECSSKADEYAEEEEDGICTMLICRAALGRILVNAEKRPDTEELVALCKVAGYDSVCGDRWTAVGTFREFILYDVGLVYPAYIIYYKRTMQAELLHKIGEASESRDFEKAMQLVPYAARLTETHPDPVISYRIALLLGAHASMAVPALMRCLQDPRSAVRRSAATALGQLSVYNKPTDERLVAGESAPVAVAAVPSLIQCLKDPSEGVRAAAVKSLATMGKHATSAVPELMLSMKDDCSDVRRAAASAFGSFGERSSPAVPQLIRCLKDDNVSVRTASAATLGALGETGGRAVPDLVASLDDANEEVRTAIATSLGLLGAKAHPATPKLIACLQAPNEAVRKAAAKSLGQLMANPTQSVPALVECLFDAHEEVRTSAATALGNFGPRAHSALPSLIRCLKDTNEHVRKHAVQAIGNLGDLGAYQHTMAFNAVSERLKDPNEAVCRAAQSAVSQLSGWNLYRAGRVEEQGEEEEDGDDEEEEEEEEDLEEDFAESGSEAEPRSPIFGVRSDFPSGRRSVGEFGKRTAAEPAGARPRRHSLPDAGLAKSKAPAPTRPTAHRQEPKAKAKAKTREGSKTAPSSPPPKAQVKAKATPRAKKAPAKAASPKPVPKASGAAKAAASSTVAPLSPRTRASSGARALSVPSSSRAASPNSAAIEDEGGLSLGWYDSEVTECI